MSRVESAFPGALAQKLINSGFTLSEGGDTVVIFLDGQPVGTAARRDGRWDFSLPESPTATDIVVFYKESAGPQTSLVGEITHAGKNESH